MRVLHLPSNVASQISVTVRALREIGIDARGLVKHNHPIEDAQGIGTLPSVKDCQYLIRRIFKKSSIWRLTLDAIKWADVIHWYCTSKVLPMHLDLKYAAFFNKARIVEFWGSDVRIPEIASADNPYIARMYRSHPKLARGKHKRSLNTQRCFARYGFECLVPDPEVGSYIQKDIWPSPYRSTQRLIISDFVPNYPDPGQRRPLVVHAPSHKAKKGTEAVLQAIGRLKNRYEFDFELIHDVEHCRALEIMRECDIMLDQFVLGSHGVAALEAMAFGKTVVSYIKPSVLAGYSNELPIVNANQQNIAEVLSWLLSDGQSRCEIGHRSRAYVEKYHDAYKIARKLVNIYQQLIEKA